MDNLPIVDLDIVAAEFGVIAERLLPSSSTEPFRWCGLLIYAEDDSDPLVLRCEDIRAFLDVHGGPFEYERVERLALEHRGEWDDPECYADREYQQGAIAAAMRKESPYDR